MPKDADSSSNAKAGADGSTPLGDSGKQPARSRNPRRRPKSERIIEETSVKRRVALEILADR